MLKPITVSKALDRLGVTYESGDDGDWFQVHWQSSTGSFATCLLLEDGGAFLNIRSIGLPKAPSDPDGRAEMLEVLNRLNRRFRVAKLMIDPEDDEITVTSEAWCADAIVNPDGIAGPLQSLLRVIEESMKEILPLVETCGTDVDEDPY